MLLIIAVAPDVEEGLRQAAARHGLTPVEFAKALVEREARAAAKGSAATGTLLMSTPSALTPEERATAFLNWAAGHRTDIPVVPMEVLSRENLYTDRRGIQCEE
jgi:hypothetical protein